MPRTKLVAGNWKMYTTRTAAESLARAVAAGVPASAAVEVAVCPPFPWLTTVANALQGSPVSLGAQDCANEKEGAFTGEVSPPMLLDAGCKYVILGHSERRHILGESDAQTNDKVHAALADGLHVILCMGETLAERQRGLKERVFQRQVFAATSGLSDEQFHRLVIAYEPIWAIGTGHTATPEQAQEAHAFIREKLTTLFGASIGQNVKILYGGSVKPDNAAGLMSQPDIDGALVGGASLKAETFLPIVQAAVAAG
ncbi:MAG: triose-phosphate isomerase [Bacteroidales bacterium]|nr:triose-phosphate isomerase [Bacteroidales bacterium]